MIINCLTHRLEINTGKEFPVRITLKGSENTLITIAKKCLIKSMTRISTDDVYEIQRTSEPLAKKLKIFEQEMKDDIKFLHEEQYIRIVMNLLYNLRIGEEHQLMAVDFVVKWIELIALYFFWSLLKKGMF